MAATDTTPDGMVSITYDDSTQTADSAGARSIAIGQNAKTAAKYAVAIGTSADVTAGNATAVGVNTKAYGLDAAAFGSGAQATAYSLALGKNAQALDIGTIAIGVNTLATGTCAMAFGYRATALGNGSIAIGPNVHTEYIVGVTPVDQPSESRGCLAIGYVAATYVSNGYEAYYHNSKNSVAIGSLAHTHAANAVAIGFSTDATGERSFAVGTSGTENKAAHLGARAAGQGSIAIGDTAQALSYEFDINDTQNALVATNRDLNVNDAIAIGTQTRARARNTVTLGSGVSYTTYGDTVNTTYGFTGSDGTEKGVEGASTAENAEAGIAIGGASQ